MFVRWINSVRCRHSISAVCLCDQSINQSITTYLYSANMSQANQWHLAVQTVAVSRSSRDQTFNYTFRQDSCARPRRAAVTWDAAWTSSHTTPEPTSLPNSTDPNPVDYRMQTVTHAQTYLSEAIEKGRWAEAVSDWNMITSQWRRSVVKYGVRISRVKPSNCFRRFEKLVLSSIFDTSLLSLIAWNLRSYPTTVLNERMRHF